MRVDLVPAPLAASATPGTGRLGTLILRLADAREPIPRGVNRLCCSKR